MEELEFSRELIKVLDTNILQKSLKKAATRGFSVPGFNKNVWAAPVIMIVAALDKKKRGGIYQYRIFLESLASLEIDNIGVEFAKKWLNEDGKCEEVAKDLMEVVSKQKDEKKAEQTEKNENLTIDVFEKIKTNSCNQKNNAEMQEQKDKIKKLHKNIQDYRIVVDDLKREKAHLVKEKNKMEKVCEDQKNEIDVLKRKAEQIELRFNECYADLKQKKEELDKYKHILEKAPKILLFSKRKIDYSIFPFYNIEQIVEWKDDYIDNMDCRKYCEIWIIESDYTYPEVQKMKKITNNKIILTHNLKSLIEKVGGIK